MSGSLDPADLLDRLTATSPQQRVLRGLVVLAAVAFLGLVPAAGGGAHPWLSVAGLVLALLAAVLPESHAPLGLVLFLGALWLVETPDRLSGWVVAAAVALLVAHVAATLAGHGPPGVSLEASLLRVWGRRTLLCAAAAVVVWLVARFAGSQPGTPSAGAVALALLVVLGWCVLVALRMGRARPH